MEIFDTQVHSWPVDWPAAVIGTAAAEDAVTYQRQIAAMEAVGVSATILNLPRTAASTSVVPDYENFLKPDNSYGEEAALAYPGRMYSVAWVEHRMAKLEQFVAGVRERPGVLGLRVPINTPQTREGLAQGEYDDLFTYAGRYDVPVFVAVSGFPDALAPAAEKHGDTLLVVDHFGLRLPQFMPESERAQHPDPFENLPALLSLSRYDNIAVKWGGAQRLSREPYPYADLWPNLHRVVEAFGPDRLMFASDWTVCRSLHSYAETVFHLRESTELSESDKSKIFAETARRLLKVER
jgi:predicted TIM-barrel fold metal-dependent hydrolase